MIHYYSLIVNMKIFLRFFSLVFCLFFSSFLLAQTVNVGYLNPVYGGTNYKYLRLGEANKYFGGFMHNYSSASYGDGDDFSIFTYGNRDMTFRTGSGNFIVFPSSGGNMGIGYNAPTQKLDVKGNIRANGYLYSNARRLYLGTSQYMYGNNSSAFYLTGNHSTVVQLLLRDKENKIFGRLYGSGDGAYFGLMDGDANWAVLVAKDNYTSFRIDNSEKMRIKSNGNVGIGITSPAYKLDVCGHIRAKEIRVQTGWCDYVFEDDYQMPTLQEEEQHIKEKGHLSGFESEEEMGGKIDLADVTKRQQEKLEQVVLHLIELEKEITQLKEENTELKQEVKDLKDK